MPVRNIRTKAIGRARTNFKSKKPKNHFMHNRQYNCENIDGNNIYRKEPGTR